MAKKGWRGPLRPGQSYKSVAASAAAEMDNRPNQDPAAVDSGVENSVRRRGRPPKRKRTIQRKRSPLASPTVNETGSNIVNDTQYEHDASIDFNPDFQSVSELKEATPTLESFPLTPERQRDGSSGSNPPSQVLRKRGPMTRSHDSLAQSSFKASQPMLTNQKARGRGRPPKAKKARENQIDKDNRSAEQAIRTKEDYGTSLIDVERAANKKAKLVAYEEVIQQQTESETHILRDK